jgi:hypothetical protein
MSVTWARLDFINSFGISGPLKGTTKSEQHWRGFDAVWKIFTECLVGRFMLCLVAVVMHMSMQCYATFFAPSWTIIMVGITMAAAVSEATIFSSSLGRPTKSALTCHN